MGFPTLCSIYRFIILGPMLIYVYVLEHVTHTMCNITRGNPFKEYMIGFGQVVEMVTLSHEFKSWR